MTSGFSNQDAFPRNVSPPKLGIPRWIPVLCCSSCSRLKVAFVEIRCSPQAAACRNVGHPSECRFYCYGATIANGATSPRRSMECTKDAVPKCSLDAMKGLPIKHYSFMLVWIASSFLCAVCIACLLRRECHSQKHRQGHNKG